MSTGQVLHLEDSLVKSLSLPYPHCVHDRIFMTRKNSELVVQVETTASIFKVKSKVVSTLNFTLKIEAVGSLQINLLIK